MSCLQNIGISWLKQVIRKIALQGFHHKDSTSCGKQGVVFRAYTESNCGIGLMASVQLLYLLCVDVFIILSGSESAKFLFSILYGIYYTAAQ